jgi:8-oxo-dGTP pyrophosphatase MutT (NUDIX family)
MYNIMSGIVDKIKSFFGKEDIPNSTSELIDIKKSEIELVKSQIGEIISSIDAHEGAYKEIMDATEDEISKGYSDGDSLKEKIESRYRSKSDDLVKSLFENKQVLAHLEDELKGIAIDSLEKAEKPKQYGDSIVRDMEGGILMLLRKNGDSFEPNKWGLPGGKIEAGEDPMDATKRELKEETNLTSEACYPMAVKELKDGGKVHYYTCIVKEDEGWIALDDDEHSNYCFMSLNEIKKRPAEDFVMDLKSTLIQMLDPMFGHIQIIKKGYEGGLVTDEEFKVSISNFNGFRFQKEVK